MSLATGPATHVRTCPNCGSPRDISEMSCENAVDGNTCGYPLTDVELVAVGSTNTSPARVAPPSGTCPNGHPVAPGDQFCVRCGADIPEVGSAATETTEPPSETVVDGWTLLSRVPGSSVDEE